MLCSDISLAFSLHAAHTPTHPTGRHKTHRVDDSLIPGFSPVIIAIISSFSLSRSTGLNECVNIDGAFFAVAKLNTIWAAPRMAPETALARVSALSENIGRGRLEVPSTVTLDAYLHLSHIRTHVIPTSEPTSRLILSVTFSVVLQIMFAA